VLIVCLSYAYRTLIVCLSYAYRMPIWSKFTTDMCIRVCMPCGADAYVCMYVLMRTRLVWHTHATQPVHDLTHHPVF
jgi:hypothetical protein